MSALSPYSDGWTIAQVVGSLIGLGIAIGVPAALELLRRRADREERLEGRRAAFVVMRAVTGAIGANRQVSPGEMEGMGEILASINASLFDESEAAILAKLRALIARHAAGVSADAKNRMTPMVANPFPTQEAWDLIEPLRQSLGVGTVRGLNNGL